MPTTGNQNQDNMSSEESALPQNNIVFTSPVTEMATIEQSEVVNQEDVTIVKASDTGNRVDSSATMEPEIPVPDAPIYPHTDPGNREELLQFTGVETTTKDIVDNPEAGVETSHVMSETPINAECLSHVDPGSGEMQQESVEYPTELEATTVESQPSVDEEPMDVETSEPPMSANMISSQSVDHVDSETTSEPPISADIISPQPVEHVDLGTTNFESSEPSMSTNMTTSAHADHVDSETSNDEMVHTDEFYPSVSEIPQDSVIEETPITTTSECVSSLSYSTFESSADQVTYTNSELSTDVQVSSLPPAPEAISAEHATSVVDNVQYLDSGMEHSASNQAEIAEGSQFVSDGISNAVCAEAPVVAESFQMSSGTSGEIADNEGTSCGDQPATEQISAELKQSEEPTVTQTLSEDITEPEAMHETDATSISNTPSGTAISSDILNDDFSPPHQVISTQLPQTQTTPLPQSSTNSFQSAFAAFASAATSAKTPPLSQEERSASSPVVNSSTVPQEPKKISVLPMPGELTESVPSQITAEAEPVTELAMDQPTHVLEQSATEHADQNQAMESESTTEMSSEASVASDAVYFIQMADAAGEVVTSIIDPNDIASYSDSVVYKQCMGADGQIETTIVSSGGMMYQEEQTQQPQAEAQAPPEPQQEMEQQVIYAHDLNGQLTPIDSSQSANDVAPPGKQFVYMQDSSGRIIRTIMDANQTMVPGQQVYYTQSEDGRIITSVMDSESNDQSAASAATTEYQQPQGQQDLTTQVEQEAQQQLVQQQHEQTAGDGTVQTVTQHGSTSGFAIDNSMSGLSMLAELTAGQAPVDLKGSSSTENNSQDADMDEFRPVAMVTRRVAEDGVETVNTDMATLRVAQPSQAGDASSDSMLAKLTKEIIGGSAPPMSVSRDNLFVQWQNLDAMCWMDVVLIMLVYSPSLQPLVNMDPTHELASTLLITLLKANRQAQVLLQNLLKRSEVNNLQNGSGITTTAVKEAKASKLVCKETMDEIGKAINILYAMREQIWQALQPRLQCERGKHNSPVLVLPLLVREKPIIKQMFTMKFRYVFKCDKCGYSQDDTHSKILPTIPAVPPTFSMKDPCFVRNCFECKAPNQRMYMKFEGLQDFVQMHFVKGLPHNRFDELSFDHNNDHYEVTAVVHYKNNPDHFIAWVRNAPSNIWMECDDLKSVVTRYQAIKPTIPPSQVHMVMWERRLTPQHVQVMRDTEDTKILSSLVLTVQQPGQDTAKPPMTTSTQSITQGVASSVLTGLINQSQTSTNFSPYTPRGRGSRGGRGRGRGRGSSNVTTLKRGINNQFISPALSSPATNRPAGSPQIIRLPLSALQGMGAQLRGASSGPSPSPQRVILMGGNSNAVQASSTTGAPQQKKVVVLRSQDGSTSLNQLSATQLLQLLQRTGAISGSNTRITTTISKASSDGTTQQQTITLTPAAPTEATAPSSLGQVLATPVTSSGQAESFEAVSQASIGSITRTQTDTVSETTSMATHEAQGEALNARTSGSPMDIDLATSTDETSEMGEVTGASQLSVLEAGIASAPSSNITTQPTPSISVLSTPPPTSESDSQSKTSTLALNSGAIRALARSGLGEGNRYVQIPNPKGGPNIMTRLIVRGDKMMLVPVDKSSASEITTHSSTTASTSSLSSLSSPPSSVRAPSSLLSAALQSSTLVPSAATQISSLSGSLPTTTITTGSAPTTRYITIPGGQGASGKRTIQLISVPKGSSANASGIASAGSTRTLILGQPSAVSTASQPASATSTSRIITQASLGDAVAAVTQQLQQQASGNVIVRELKQSVDSNETASSVTSVTLSGESGTQTPLHGGAVSLLRDVSGKSSADPEDRAQGISILSPASVQMSNRTQESFKYILPGSNTQQMASVQTVSGAQLGSKAFTALSSSGTIIGGQLTTVNTSDMTPSPVDSVDAGVQSLYPELDAINPTVITTTRGRGARGGRGGRGGRGRGYSKTPRGGRGGRQNQIILGQQQIQAKLAGQPGTVTMLPADFHGIGGQIIQTSTESVDGAPVVSIPDFSSSAVTMQTESQQIISDPGLITAANTVDPLCPPAENMSSPLHQTPIHTQEEGTPDPTATQGPRVITQPIPSIKANHGFDILTQGILGNAQTPPPSLGTTRKTGISLLTGKTVTSPPLLSTSPSHSSSPSLFASDVTRMQQTLAMGHSVSQNEIETLIKAAQGAAKPPKPGQTIAEASAFGEQSSDDGNKDQMEAVDAKIVTSTQDQSGFNVDDFLNGSKNEDKSSVGENTETRKERDDMEEDSMDTSEPAQLEGSSKQRVFSIDESQVSAAERYRMPTELFQPDEESPEKPVRSDSISRHISGSSILGEDLPSKLFHDSEISSQEEEIVKSPTQQAHQQQSMKSPEKESFQPAVMKSPDVDRVAEHVNDVDFGVVDQTVNAGASIEEEQVVENDGVLENLKSSPKARNKRSGSRKKRRSSSKHSFSENEDVSAGVDSSPLSPNDKKGISNPMKEELNLVAAEKEEVSVGGFASDVLSSSPAVGKQPAYVCEDEEEKIEEVEPSHKVLEESVCKMEEDVVENKVDTDAEKMCGANVAEEPVCKMEEENVIESKVDFVSKKVCGDEKNNMIVEKQLDKENVSPVSVRKPKSRKRVFDLPIAIVVNKKHKADWSSEEIGASSNVFSYSLLTRTRNKRTSRRHASLGPVISSFTSAPVPFEGLLREKDDLGELLTCVVKRRHTKALERPKVDPSKEPTVVPLVPEEDADPACTFGGSVVTIPDKGEVFTGVVVRQRREIADWNSVTFDEEGDSFSNQWEDQEAMKEYLETMWTSMCMEIGFASFFDKCDFEVVAASDGEEEEEEGDESDEEDIDGSHQNVYGKEESAIITDGGVEDETENGDDSEILRLPKSANIKENLISEEMGANSMQLPEHEEEATQATSVNVTHMSPNIVTLENDLSTNVTPKEALALSTTTLPSSSSVSTANVTKKISTFSSSPSKSPITSTSCFNGFSKSESVVSTLPFIHSVSPSPSISLLSPPPNLSSAAATIPPPATAIVSSNTSPLTLSSSTAIRSSAELTSSSSKKRSKPPTPTTTPAFISPARRSSRTPVPSLKVRDSFDESGGGLAMKLLSKTKNRRSSALSSDDDLSGSGYNSDDVAIKKKKKFQVTS